MKCTKEQAADVLERYTDRKDFDPTYYEAIRDEQLPAYYCLTFARYKLYSDDLPGPRLVGEWHPDYPAMKCRGNVIIGIASWLQSSVDDEIIKDTTLQRNIQEFGQKQWNFSRGAKGEYWTQLEEIQLINTMLDRVMLYLEKTYRVKPDWEKAKQEVEQMRRQCDYLRDA